jgi:hypothetical protein
MIYLVFLLLMIFTHGCKKYETNNPRFYCDDIVKWKVSTETQENAWSLNKQAYSLYYDLKTRYVENKNSSAPSLSCLAVAREFFCAYSFPYCKDEVNDPNRGVCTFLCDIFKKRCPDEDHHKYCKNSKSQDCSFGKYFVLGLLFALIL